MSLPFPFFVFVPPPLMRPTESAMRHVPGFDPGWRRYRRGGFWPPRHHMAPPQGACGRGCAPVPNPIWGRGLSERSACPEQREGTLNQQSTVWKSRFLVSLGMTTERHRMGPRPGAHGFGSFCRNKRISPCGGETPQTLPLIRTASVIQKLAEPVQDRQGNFMPPSKFMPGHGEPMLDQGVLELDSGVVRK